MSVIYADTALFLGDMFKSLGFGALVCFMMWPLSCSGRGVASFLLHGLFGTAAGWLAVFFICGSTYCRSPRWFVLLGMGLGFWSCRTALLPHLKALLRLLISAAAALLGAGYGVLAKVIAPLFGVLLKIAAPMLSRLKNRGRILYNLIRKNPRRTPRGTKDGPKIHKEPIKAAKAP